MLRVIALTHVRVDPTAWRRFQLIHQIAGNISSMKSAIGRSNPIGIMVL
jgi:hypothetical protein